MIGGKIQEYANYPPWSVIVSICPDPPFVSYCQHLLEPLPPLSVIVRIVQWCMNVHGELFVFEIIFSRAVI